MTNGLPVRLLLLSAICAFSSASAVSLQELAGDYDLYYEQTAKDCGALIDPIETSIRLRTGNGKLRVQFPSGILGVTVLEADYGGGTDEIIQEFSQRVDLGETKATLKLTLRARIRKKADKPQVLFTIVFNKIADDPAWNCRVSGHGIATKN